MKNSRVVVSPFLVLFSKALLLLFSGVYVLAVPFLYLLKGGDALLPFESVLCVVASVGLFVWSGLCVRALVKR